MDLLARLKSAGYGPAICGIVGGAMSAHVDLPISDYHLLNQMLSATTIGLPVGGIVAHALAYLSAEKEITDTKVVEKCANLGTAAYAAIYGLTYSATKLLE